MQLHTKAAVKNKAPPKQGVKNGLVPGRAQLVGQGKVLSQADSSRPKLIQAKSTPASKIKN